MSWSNADVVEETNPQQAWSDADVVASRKPQTSQERAKSASDAMTGASRGAVEAGISMLTGLPASVAGGLRGLYGLATGDTTEEAARKVQDTQESMTYSPRTQEGRNFVQAAGVPFELAGQGAGYVGGKVGKALGNEAAGQSIGEASIPVGMTLLGGVGAVRGARGAVAPKPPEIPIVSDFGRGVRDVYRTKSAEGRSLIAEEWLRKQTTPEDASKIVSGLERRSSEVVPGSPVTSADAIARANREAALLGRPERFGGQYVAIQEGLAKLPETSGALTTVKLLQEKARSDAMAIGAGSEKAYAAGKLTREANANVAYKKLTDSNAIVDTAKTVRLIDRIIDAKPANKTLVTAMDDVKSSLIASVDDGKSYALRTNPGQLQSAIENINILMSKQENVPVRRQLMVAKSSLESQINKVEAAQGIATKQYAIDSLPLNQMDLWRFMQDKFITPTGKEAPGSYLRLMRDETKTIKQATGFKRGESVSNIFNEKQSSLAARLAAEMEMELVKNRMAGEVNVAGIGKAAEDLGPRLPNMLMRETMVGNFILKILAKDANVAVNIAAANILSKPKMLAGVLKQVKVENRPGVLKFLKDAAINKDTAILSLTNLQAQQDPQEETQ